MKNKRGILGAIFLVVAIILFLIGAFFYHQIKTNGLIISTGKFIINIGYNDSNAPPNLREIIIPEQSAPNSTESNITVEDNNIQIEDIPIINYSNLDEPD